MTLKVRWPGSRRRWTVFFRAVFLFAEDVRVGRHRERLGRRKPRLGYTHYSALWKASHKADQRSGTSHR